MNTRFLMMVCACLLFLTTSMASPVMARNAKCLIQSSGVTQYRGVCDFQADSNGSFSLSAAQYRRFLKNIDLVSVTILSKRKADVRGLTTAGINSRWGSARRSRKDRACWIGSDFKICAW